MAEQEKRKEILIVVAVVVVAVVGYVGSYLYNKVTTVILQGESLNTVEEAVVAQDPNAFEVIIEVQATEIKEGVIFDVTTNLPKDTTLLLSLCDEDGIIEGQDKITIDQNGKGEGGPFKDGSQLHKGKHTLNVCSGLPDIQEDSVERILGQNGELIYGIHVKKCYSLIDPNVWISNWIDTDFAFEF